MFLINPYRFVTWTSNWLLNNLVSYYKCDTNWSFPDAHWSNNWTINGATYTASWKINWAYSFDGVNDYVTITSASLSLTTFSISCFIKRDTTATSSTDDLIISKDWDASWTLENYFIRLWRWKDTANWYIDFWFHNWSAYVTLITDTAVITDTNFHLITITYNNTTSTWVIYIDWVAVKTWTLSWTPITATWPLDIWRAVSTYDWNRYFSWIIDEVWIWDTVLTNTQITTLYNSWAWLSYNDFTT